MSEANPSVSSQELSQERGNTDPNMLTTLQSYSCLESSGELDSSCGRSSLSSVNSQESSPNETSDSAKNPFRKCPILQEYYSRPAKWNSDRSITSHCRFCPKIVNDTHLSRLIGHIANCPNTTPEQKAKIRPYLIELMSSADKFSLKVANYVVMQNISLRSVDSDEFRALWSKHNNVHLPTRSALSAIYIPAIAARGDLKWSEEVSKLRDYSLSIEFDHWKDLSGRSLLAVLATLPNGSKYLLDLVDVSLKGHSAAEIVSPIRKILEPIDPRKINSITSDSASSCQNARRILVQDKSLKHVIEHRCLAHLLNRMGAYITSRQGVKELIEIATLLASFIKNSLSLSAKIRHSSSKSIQKASATRWYSQVNMVESLLGAKEEIIKNIAQLAKENHDLAIQLQEDFFWTRLRELSAILKPLANCIGVAEQSGGSSGEAVKHILEFGRDIFKKDWSDDIVIAAVSGFLVYFSEDKLGQNEFMLHLTAYFLDKSSKRRYLTKEALLKIYETMCDFAKLSEYPNHAIRTNLPNEFKLYCRFESYFSKPIQPNQCARDWWETIPEISIIRNLGSRISRIKSSSANIERVFSMLKLVQSICRTNFNESLLRDIAKAKLFLSGNFDDWTIDAPEAQVEADADDDVVSVSYAEKRRESSVELAWLDCDDTASLQSQQSVSSFRLGLSHQINLLPSIKLRNLYQNFSCYINFDHEPVIPDPSSQLSAEDEEQSGEFVAELVQKMRSNIDDLF